MLVDLLLDAATDLPALLELRSGASSNTALHIAVAQGPPRDMDDATHSGIPMLLVVWAASGAPLRTRATGDVPRVLCFSACNGRPEGNRWAAAGHENNGD